MRPAFTRQTMATNPNFQEFLQDGDYLEEDWQRVYDLRFCTILVPLPPHLANRTAAANIEEDHAVSDEPNEHCGNEDHVQGQHQPQPDTMMEKAAADHQISPPASESNSPSTSHLQTEACPSQTNPSKPVTAKRCTRASSKEGQLSPRVLSSPPSSTPMDTDQSRETRETQLHQSHELARDDEYMTTSKAAVELSQPTSSTDTVELDCEDEDQADASGSAAEASPLMSSCQPKSTPAKRKHWELDQSQGLLHPCQPDSPPKRVTLSSPTSPGGIITVGRTPQSLLKPRSYEPSATWSTSYMSQSSFGGAASSSSNDSLYKSTVPLSLHQTANDGPVWSNGNWKDLKKVYLEMNGDAQSDAGIGLIADRFLAEDAARNRGESKWERSKILTRCIALQMVGKERQRLAPARPIKLPPTPYTPLLSPLQAHSVRRQVRTTCSPVGIHRSGRTATPLNPNPLLQDDEIAKSVDSQAPSSKTSVPIGVSGSDESTSSTGAEQLATQRRTYRNSRVKEQDPEQGSQLKSIVKTRLAESLDSVRQLLGFWKEVEQGNSETREEVLVPLVPLHRVQSVVEAFESGSMVLSPTSECVEPAEESASIPAVSAPAENSDQGEGESASVNQP